MTTSLRPADATPTLSRQRVEPDHVIDELERANRREVIRDVWARVPRKLAKATPPPVFEAACKAWCDGASLVLLGPTGAGKSAAAVHLVGRLCRSGVRDGGEAYELAKGILWTRTDELTAAGGRDDLDAERLLHRAHWCRLLVLDDVARCTTTLQRILEHRYDKARPVILTSGARNEGELAEILGGDAVFRWVLEAGHRRGKVVAA